MLGGPPARKRRQPPKERIDRSRGNANRDSSSASGRSANWKSPQTEKVTKGRVVSSTRRQNTPPYSSSSEDADARSTKKSTRDKGKHADSQEDEDSDESEDDSEEEEGNCLLVKQNKSNQTYNYKMATSGRPSGTMTTMGTQSGKKSKCVCPN